MMGIDEKLEYLKVIETNKVGKKGTKEFEIKRNGIPFWVKETQLPIYNEKDQVIGYATVQLDITKCKKLEKLAITDGLTGLYNRRHFNEVLTREIQRAKRDKTKLAFMMIDVDYFKKYNDTYGHDAGDKVLIAVANVLKKTLHRGGDYAFRLGGEEFGVLIAQTDKKGAMTIAEKLIKQISNLEIEHANSLVAKYVTVSIGVLIVDFSKEDVDKHGFYTMADDALYQAKNNGRNQAVLYENEDVDFF